MTSFQSPTRIKSAAFLRKPELKQIEPSTRFSSSDSHQLRFSQIAVSESRFINSRMQTNDKNHRKVASASRFTPLRTNMSSTSEIWRQVNTSKSQFRLNSLCINGEESVRINLREKVQRIKSKHKEYEQIYQNCISAISRKALERVKTIKQQGISGNLHLKIMELMAPFQIEKERAQQRYRTRLLRIKKV